MRSLLALLLLSTAAFAQPVSLFDGKSLDGWDFDPAIWRVEDGMITGGSTTEKIKENYFICTKKSYQNFELKLKIKVSGDPKTGMLNSGIQIRSLRVPGTAHMCGYQVDCGAGWFGKIYDEFRRNKVIWAPTPEQQTALDKVIDVFGWNEYRIRAEGPRIQTWINGVLCMDYVEEDKNVALDGLIGPQVHSGGVCLVQVKDVTIEELPATPNAPTWQSLGGIDAARAKVAPPKKTQADAGKPAKRDISYNNVQGTPLTAEEQIKKFHLPEGYEIELVVKESPGIGKFVSVYFDQRGRLWTQTALEYPVDGNENPAAAEAVYAAKGKDKVLVYPREALNTTLPAGGLTNPIVFADGLAIPLGLLPWGNGDSAYVLHGHDVLLMKDTNSDGKADESKVILTGFGVQDSHLFPHQFTRAPGGWIWMAQGLFNNSKVHKPGEDANVIDYPKCSMARMRPDGSEFEVTSLGPNNIWGLVITGEGEAFIQEANDYGYPVMPFHEYAYYPGGMEALRKSYQPEFPVQTPDFKMGGTGLSGLALGEGELKKVASASAEGQKDSTKAEPTLCMFVANPIISKVQTLAMHREDSRKDPQRAPNGWRYEQAADLVTCDDPFFRPVAMTQGPDGCLYIVDWYNKIISHNEVPRNHPDRDKIRGRIWRVKPKASDDAKGARTLLSASNSNAASPPDSKEADRSVRAPMTIPDFTKLSTEELIALLGTKPTARAHLAWQTLADRGDIEGSERLWKLVNDGNQSVSKRVQAHWTAPNSVSSPEKSASPPLLRTVIADTPDSTFEFEADFGEVPTSEAPEVRQAAIQRLAKYLQDKRADHLGVLSSLLSFAKPSLTQPTAPGRTGKPIPVGEAYDREFERFLVRMFLERHPDVVVKFLDTDEAAKLPVEARVLASLALEPKASASRVAKLLPQLDRAPNDEELLRLAQFPEEAGCGDALKALLSNPKSRTSVAEKLLAQKTKLDPTKIAPLLSEAAKALLSGKDDERALSVSLIGGFQLASLESDLVTALTQLKEKLWDRATRRVEFTPDDRLSQATMVSLLQALKELRSTAAELFVSLSTFGPTIRDEALAALAVSKNPSAAEQLFALYPTLSSAQQHAALNALSASKPGAKAIVAALASNKIPKTDLDGPTAERLSLVLGNDAELNKLMASLGHVFHDVLAFDGSEEAWIDSKITLDGTFTVETWIKLAPGIGNEDDILGVPGGVEMNFFGSTFRVFAGPKLHDVAVAKKPMTPDLWTHIAVTRDEKGFIKIYQNGELDAVSKVPAPDKWENCRIGWSGPKKGTEGVMTEFRIWKKERTAQEIRQNFDRVLNAGSKLERETWIKVIGDIVMSDSEPRQGTFVPSKVQPQPRRTGARLAKAIDTPPLLTAEQADALDKKFAHLSTLDLKKGSLAQGKALSMICKACHMIGPEGGQIGPNLSGAGAMGLEGVLRNILTPNAAMESGYRIFRVELKSGDIVDALFVSEDKEAFVVRQPGVQDRRIAKKDVRSTRYIRRSLMPEGLIDGLNDQQATDLISYLMTLKG
ncbi:MAG: DUF1080 domain-containing protein [Verrucomicrobiaceae bacterium]|nr:DUF1080 domain-containing protein [Verrucomicrobiaceae bacterium]